MGYPTTICVPCRSKVESFYKFREQCIQNDEYLRSTFLEPEVVIKTEPDFFLGTPGDEEDDDDDDINEADIEEWDESESNDVSEEMQIDTSSNGMEFPVQTCLSSNNGIDFSRHASLVPLFKCEFCSSEFSILEHLEKHITSHKEEKIFKCFYCPKTFHFAKNLNMHVEYIHSKVKFSQRTANKASENSPNQRDRHETSLLASPSGVNINNNIVSSPNEKPIDIHSPVNVNRGPPVRVSHECHVCHKSFSDLRQHMLLHDGEKPYKCDICSKAFFNASTLKTHYRVHSDENPFRCTTCTKVFDNARSLELHYRTHTGKALICLKQNDM
ncbi:zinc finger protein 728-like [Armigeres subalbatus]|uniref:zinc finger protein 728-like n=1 Tax=Armigeres subalbatus TaxID=124917 RepID=UPI002ED55B50